MLREESSQITFTADYKTGGTQTEYNTSAALSLKSVIDSSNVDSNFTISLAPVIIDFDGVPRSRVFTGF